MEFVGFIFIATVMTGVGARLRSCFMNLRGLFFFLFPFFICGAVEIEILSSFCKLICLELGQALIHRGGKKGKK